VILIYLFFAVIFAIICASVAKSKNRETALWGVLGFFFGIFALIILLVIEKREPQFGHQAYGQPQALPGYGAQPTALTASQAGLPEEIGRWKELLDSGAISDDEFAAKKAELLARK